MFLKLIKDYFIKKEVKINPESYKPNCDTVGVVIDKGQLPNYKELITLLQNDVFKDFSLFFLIFDEKKADGDKINSDYISSKSYTLTGDFKDPLIDDFVKKDYFLLLGVYQNNPYLNKIINCKFAKYKIGFNQVNNHIFNVSLNGSMIQDAEFIEPLKLNLKSFNIIK